MDFFEHQEAAKRNTGRLIVLFVLAVVSVIVLVYVVVAAIAAVVRSNSTPTQIFNWAMLWDPTILLLVGSSVVSVVVCASLYKIGSLRGGGQVIAETLGGRLIEPGTANPSERKLLNIIEEMAIASGTSVPQVYLLDKEGGINAFAAGFSPGDAVVGVTRGCIEVMDRDQLQGVIAHEFSHILNGDMKLNLRLIGVIHGILVIGLIGQVMFHSLFYAPRRRSRKDSGGVIAIMAMAVALIVIGAIGVFFAKLIKASVSRQREFLADAAAVQFTRNPSGIGGALKKIGGFTFGSNLLSPQSEQASHMFFARGLTSWFGSMMDTHPPLPIRIGRVDSDWDGVYPQVKVPQSIAEKAQTKQQRFSRVRAVRGHAFTSLPAGAVMADMSAPTALAQIGRPTRQHLDYASDLIAAIPQSIKYAAHEPFGARAVIHALLLDENADVRRIQIEHLKAATDAAVYQYTEYLQPLINDIDVAARLPLVDMAMPALRELSSPQYKVFTKNITELIRVDRRIDLFEWVLNRVVVWHLGRHFGDAEPPRTRYYSLTPLAPQCATLLSTIAFAGQHDVAEAQHAFAQGAKWLALGELALLPADQCGLNVLDEAIDALLQVSPREKKTIIAACGACISADRQVTVKEGELLRGISDSFDCPMPPLLPGQSLT